MTGIARYRSTKVQSAPKQQVVILLLEEAIKRVGLARVCITEALPYSTLIGHLHHAREILLELDGALDFDAAPELCGQLRGLYRWCLDELIAVGGDKDIAHLDGVSRPLESLLIGWRSARP